MCSKNWHLLIRFGIQTIYLRLEEDSLYMIIDAILFCGNLAKIISVKFGRKIGLVLVGLEIECS